MRTLLGAALLLLAAACNDDNQQAANAGCDRSATHEVSWSNDAAPDVVTASSQGPSCAQAVVTLVIRNADGDPLWAVASTYYDLTMGGRGAEEPPPVSDEEMDAFLASWANVTLNRSNELPEWREDADTLAASEGMPYYTDFNREAYNELRTRNLPQLCYAAAAEGSQCLIIDPQTHAPLKFVAVGG